MFNGIGRAEFFLPSSAANLCFQLEVCDGEGGGGTFNSSLIACLLGWVHCPHPCNILFTYFTRYKCPAHGSTARLSVIWSSNCYNNCGGFIRRFLSKLFRAGVQANLQFYTLSVRFKSFLWSSYDSCEYTFPIFVPYLHSVSILHTFPWPKYHHDIIYVHRAMTATYAGKIYLQSKTKWNDSLDAWTMFWGPWAVVECCVVLEHIRLHNVIGFFHLRHYAMWWTMLELTHPLSLLQCVSRLCQFHVMTC